MDGHTVFVLELNAVTVENHRINVDFHALGNVQSLQIRSDSFDRLRLLFDRIIRIIDRPAAEQLAIREESCAWIKDDVLQMRRIVAVLHIDRSKGSTLIFSIEIDGRARFIAGIPVNDRIDGEVIRLKRHFLIVLFGAFDQLASAVLLDMHDHWVFQSRNITADQADLDRLLGLDFPCTRIEGDVDCLQGRHTPVNRVFDCFQNVLCLDRRNGHLDACGERICWSGHRYLHVSCRAVEGQQFRIIRILRIIWSVSILCCRSLIDRPFAFHLLWLLLRWRHIQFLRGIVLLLCVRFFVFGGRRLFTLRLWGGLFGVWCRLCCSLFLLRLRLLHRIFIRLRCGHANADGPGFLLLVLNCGDLVLPVLLRLDVFYDHRFGVSQRNDRYFRVFRNGDRLLQLDFHLFRLTLFAELNLIEPGI